MFDDLGVSRGKSRFTVSGAGKKPTVVRKMACSYIRTPSCNIRYTTKCLVRGADRPDTKRVYCHLLTRGDKTPGGVPYFSLAAEGKTWHAVIVLKPLIYSAPFLMLKVRWASQGQQRPSASERQKSPPGSRTTTILSALRSRACGSVGRAFA